MSNRKKLPLKKPTKELPAPPLQWYMDDMERTAQRLAAELHNAFSGSNPPGLRALWMEDHIRAIGKLEMQYKTLDYARQKMGSRGG